MKLFVVLSLLFSVQVLCTATPKLEPYTKDNNVDTTTPYTCPFGVQSSIPGENVTTGFGLRFCSDDLRWNKNNLHSRSKIILEPTTKDDISISDVAILCADKCHLDDNCNGFSVVPTRGSEGEFWCESYYSTIPLREKSNGGLFYQRKAIDSTKNELHTVKSSQNPDEIYMDLHKRHETRDTLPPHTPDVTSSLTNTIYQCPGNLRASYPGQAGTQLDLKFCSDIFSWDPKDLFQTLSTSNASYTEASRQCSLDCVYPKCNAFSIVPDVVGVDTFSCNLYKASNVFQGSSNGGLFYTRALFKFPESSALEIPPTCFGAPEEISNGRIYSRRMCTKAQRWSAVDLLMSTLVNVTMSSNYTTAVADAATRCALKCTIAGEICKAFSASFTRPYSLADYPYVYPIPFNCNMYRVANRVPATPPYTAGNFYEKHISQSTADTLCSQATTPHALPAFAPQGSSDHFLLAFCSNTKRWAIENLMSSYPIWALAVGNAVNECSDVCGQDCAAFSVSIRKNTDKRGNWNCSVYSAQTISNGSTLGGLFYSRRVGPGPDRTTCVD